MKRLQPERAIEAKILCFLSELGIWSWKNPSVGTYSPKQGVFLKSRNKFHKNGVSDIIAVHNGKCIFIEVKAPKGRVSPEQALFIKQANERLALAFVARSVGEVWAEISHIFREAEYLTIMPIVRRWVQIEEFENSKE